MQLPWQNPRYQQITFAVITFVLALYILVKPFSHDSSIKDVGFWLVLASLLVYIQGYKRSSVPERKSAHASALITLLMGVLMINAGLFQTEAVFWFALVLFIFDAFRQLLTFYRFWEQKKSKKYFLTPLLSFIGNLAIIVALFSLRGKAMEWLLSITGALRIAGMGFEMLSARIGSMQEVGEDVVKAMKLQDHPEMIAIAKKIEKSEASRASVDRYWVGTFLVLLFFIHLGRIGFDRSNTGILSPLIALIGDIVAALIIAFLILIPLTRFRKFSRPVDKFLWRWVIKKPEEKRSWWDLRNFVQPWLEYRMSMNIRVRKSGYSFITAFRTALQMGLPYAALLTAIVPIFGMSWYFDTENWASGIWDRWAAKNTNHWRAAMVQAVDGSPTAKSFQVFPPGVSNTGTFSFLIVGDPGEGDASQYILHDQIVTTSEKDEVKFVVISSDVVYPDGAMKDYEKKFWLPMKGVHKPVYAIPGNHDWYDALEGFAATFYEPEVAQRAMQARRDAELLLTSSASAPIDVQIAEAARLRKEYEVPTGFQRAPYFQLQTRDFAFICIETGVTRSIDTVQMSWLKQTLEASKGKFIFALLGHPFYAQGEYQGNMTPEFAELHKLLRDYGATITMGGDTHDLEYYIEPSKEGGPKRPMHHFVNGGGGAYLSLGAALRPKDDMAEKVWAHYPSAEPFIEKIENNNGWFKRPFWIWTKKYHGYPFSPEWLSAAFDYNTSPFFQSFIEVEVNPAQNVVKLKAHGVRGPLKWSEMAYSEGLKPAGLTDDAPVEWEFPLRAR